MGASYEGMGKDREAAEYYERAVKLTEEIRSGLTADQKARFFDVRISGFRRTAPYEGLSRTLTRLGRPLEALNRSEYTKARLFAEAMSRRGQGMSFRIPPRLLEKDRELNDQLAPLKKSLRKGYEKKNLLVIKALEPQVRRKEEDLRAHIGMLRKEYPFFAATKYPQPMELSNTALKASEWVLSYDVTDTGVVVFLTKGREVVKGLFKAVPRKELDALVRRFRSPLEMKGALSAEKLRSFDFAAGKKLSDILVTDMLPMLPKGVPLIVVPDDSLGVLPFEML